MIERRKIIVFIFFWICAYNGVRKVQACTGDAINPVKVISDTWHQRSVRVAVRTNDYHGCGRHNVYICEEPLDTVPPEALKTCTYRNQSYHEQVFRWVAGRGCLLYTPDFLFVGGANTINLNEGCFYGNWFAPCLEMVKADGTCGCYPFDPGLEVVAKAVREALVPVAHTRWERCFYAAQQCCSHFMDEDVFTDRIEPSHCETTFDGWTCWPPVEAGSVASEVCSEFAYIGQKPSCNHYSSKRCLENGTWELQTDYSSCSISPRLLSRYRFYIAVLSFSIVFCLPAVFVFVFYKRLRITTVALHRNLLIAITVKNILVIISRVEVYIDELTSIEETVMSSHGIWCRLLAAAERVAANTVFLCVLVEGIYLHRAVVTDQYNLNLKWLYAVGGVMVAISPVILWAMMMALHDDHSCWLVYTTRHIQWMLDGPCVVVLIITTVLIVNALRILLTKERNAHNIHQLSTAKATLSLMPVFSAQFLVNAFRPTTSDCTWEQIYYYAASSLDGLQGFLVAMLYCFVNKEVQALIKLTYTKTGNLEDSRMPQEPSSCKQLSFNSNHITFGTAPSNKIEDRQGRYATIKSKLHVAEIISIPCQSAERLADIMEPDYESICGIHNEGYDSLDRPEHDNDAGFMDSRLNEEDDFYYGSIKDSSVSIECQDWVQCISQSSSFCEYSLSDIQSGSDFVSPYQNHTQEIQSKSIVLESESNNVPVQRTSKEQMDMALEYEDCDNNNMLQEIMQCMASPRSASADLDSSSQNSIVD